MKKIITLHALLSIFFLSTLHAQSAAPAIKREIGIRMPGFTDFDFIYKKQKGENKYSRIRLVSTNFSVSDFDFFTGSFSMGLAYGREKRKPLNNGFSFLRGWELIGKANLITANNSTRLVFTPGVGYVLGFQYDINDKFAVNIETIPSLSADINISSRATEVSNLHLGFNSNSIALGVMCKF